MHFNFKLSLLDKLQPIIHNNADSREQVILSESGETSTQTEHRLRVKTALNKHVGGFWCERYQEMDLLSTGGSLIMNYGLVFWS